MPDTSVDYLVDADVLGEEQASGRTRLFCGDGLKSESPGWRTR
jgi:hypothetical protein